jgi:hypothetical protein
MVLKRLFARLFNALGQLGSIVTHLAEPPLDSSR